MKRALLGYFFDNSFSDLKKPRNYRDIGNTDGINSMRTSIKNINYHSVPTMC